MKLRNEKGFTLIELIATITILGIIMLIAVPNVVSVVTKNKNQTYVNDARKMVTLAKYKFDSDASIIRPTNNTCVSFKLSSLDRSELQKGPEDGTYSLNDSFVTIRYVGTQYVYYVQLKEEKTVNSKNVVKGIPFMEYSNLVKIEAKNTAVSTTPSNFLNVNSLGTKGCNTSSQVYS